MIFTLIQVKICPKKTNSSAVTKLHNDLDLMSGQIQFWAEVSVDLRYESSSTRTSALHVNCRCHSRAEPGLLDLSGLWSGAADRQTWRLIVIIIISWSESRTHWPDVSCVSSKPSTEKRSEVTVRQPAAGSQFAQRHFSRTNISWHTSFNLQVQNLFLTFDETKSPKTVKLWYFSL